MNDIPNTDKWLDERNPVDREPECPCTFYVGRCECEGEDCPYYMDNGIKKYCKISSDYWEDD